MSGLTEKRRALWALGVASAAVFMVTLDNLVVTNALPVIRRDLHASLQSLEWTVNAYTLTFAVLLLTGAALGDRFGRKRMLAIGLGLFTVASAAAALAPSASALVVARAAQGIGGALVMPLTLTIIAAAMPKEKRAAAIGIWGGVAGLAVALGPVVGGAIVDGISWHWIFWINVPIGIVLVPLALRQVDETYGRAAALDVRGLVLASAGLFGVVWGVVRSQQIGWGSGEVVFALTAGTIGVIAFLAWQLAAEAPMLPLRLFADRTFAAANAATFLMYLGFFGAVFLITQYWQFAHGYSPLGAGLRVLPWTVMPIFVGPAAATLAPRIGERPLLVTGLALMAGSIAWLGYVSTPTAAYSSILPALALGGFGISLFWAPSASVVLSAVAPEDEGIASGANNAVRELGGVFGVAVLTTIFSTHGSFASPDAFVHGMRPAFYVGAVLLAAAAAAAFALPRKGSGRLEPGFALGGWNSGAWSRTGPGPRPARERKEAMYRVIVLYDDEPNADSYAEHVELCKQVPNGVFRHGKVTGAPMGDATHAYYAEWEFADEDAFRNATRSDEFMATGKDAYKRGFPQPTVEFVELD